MSESTADECLRYVTCFVQNNGVSPQTALTDSETRRVVCQGDCFATSDDLVLKFCKIYLF